MNINVTLFIQVFVFLALVVAIMKYAWPQFEEALNERADKISKGLADAERAAYKLKQADEEVEKIIKQCKQEAKVMLDKARLNAGNIIDDAKQNATKRAEQMIEEATFEIEVQKNIAKEALMKEISEYSMQIVNKVLVKHVNTKISDSMIRKSIEEEMA
ncbi:MAG: ATP synthase F0 subunit B [Legionellales bacterium]|jgi:F-type H+-transporting ATPase subunit b|nr:ATP synthase F0 subunit B [Legionellales bacterium]OUX65960.1 MAG: ATP synthase F0 subunit B [Gammaproteobacteria bacterium TMED281]|tara:strand:- start:3471 stop:3947 length:477 start_codon:yes stop_codon:yes gene_type:complete